MPKINFGIADGADVEASQGFPQYRGKLPENGVYEGVLKVMKVLKIAKGDNAGKSRLQIVVTLKDPNYPEYDGCPVFDNKNVTDQGVPFLNQMLESITDGSDAAMKAVKNAFWKTGPIVDNEKEHILKIGKINVNSPQGAIQVLVATKQNTYNGNTTCQVRQWLQFEGEDTPTEDEQIVEEDDEPIDVADDDDDDPYEDDDVAEDDEN
jgi:hypothetical protein